MDAQRTLQRIDEGNLSRYGFFCCKSKAKSEGYQRKLRWLHARFNEGMQMHLSFEGDRSVGFIEYIPGPYAWRALHAPECMVIHCIWVVGRAKGQGRGSELLEQCIADARRAGMEGVAMVTSRSVWLAGSELFLRHGFTLEGSSAPCFDLVVRRFNGHACAAFPEDLPLRPAAAGPGLTVYRTDQCPYIDDATRAVEAAGRQVGIPVRTLEMNNAGEVQRLSPTAYGTFCITLNNALLSYSYLLEKDLVSLLSA